MQTEDEKPEGQRRRRFCLRDVAELITEIENLKPKFKLLKRAQAAEYLATRGATNYTSKALANLASRGLGPPYLKLGNEAYYLEHDLDAWVL